MRISVTTIKPTHIKSLNSTDDLLRPTPEGSNPMDNFDTSPSNTGLTKTVNQIVKMLEEKKYHNLTLSQDEADLVYTPKVKQQIISNKFLPKHIMNLYNVKGKKNLTRNTFKKLRDICTKEGMIMIGGLEYVISYVDTNPNSLPIDIVLSLRSPKIAIVSNKDGSSYLNNYCLVMNNNHFETI